MGVTVRAMEKLSLLLYPAVAGAATTTAGFSVVDGRSGEAMLTSGHGLVVGVNRARGKSCVVLESSGCFSLDGPESRAEP